MWNGVVVLVILLALAASLMGAVYWTGVYFGNNSAIPGHEELRSLSQVMIFPTFEVSNRAVVSVDTPQNGDSVLIYVVCGKPAQNTILFSDDCVPLLDIVTDFDGYDTQQEGYLLFRETLQGNGGSYTEDLTTFENFVPGKTNVVTYSLSPVDGGIQMLSGSTNIMPFSLTQEPTAVVTDIPIPPTESPTETPCLCNYAYSVGETVTFIGEGNALPYGSVGEVICGSLVVRDWILVKWDDYTDGAVGVDNFCFCGNVDVVRTEAMNYVDCADVGGGILTEALTLAPTEASTVSPSEQPTSFPTSLPTSLPSPLITLVPSDSPSADRTFESTNPPTEGTNTCIDDPEWNGGFGDCESYALGQRNNNFCSEDENADGVLALDACCVSCSETCAPDCSFKTCGDDGCGGSCGNCQNGGRCNAGNCVCAPDCSDKVCGDDGCKGSCGLCQDEICNEGNCESSKPNNCGNYKNKTFSEAENQCEQDNRRMCSWREIQFHLFNGTSCLVNESYTWSSTKCNNGERYKMVRIYEGETASDDQKCADETEEGNVKCCEINPRLRN
eukprot:TRINITY_DN391_c0_g1_i2.p1 TRINITY_DN391_c0_g1~~TRINITY_DN391_c0_g1_i2.p1  ORF type:complete len:557 (-),score=93.41 TRINITY_DN391_c0_g1_i2:193-1863(-)